MDTDPTPIPVDPDAIPFAEHPGAELADTLERRGLTKYRLARASGVTPSCVGDIVAGRRAITAETSIRFGRALGTSPGFWLSLQVAYDLWLAAKSIDIDAVVVLDPFDPAEPETRRALRAAALRYGETVATGSADEMSEAFRAVADAAEAHKEAATKQTTGVRRGQ